jgi:hypothetical protein
VVNDTKHHAWLNFIQKAASVPSDYSKEDMKAFRRIAARESPSLVPLIDAYLNLAQQSDTATGARRSAERKGSNGGNMHLFDLLREKRLFPQNLLLAQFASRVLPHMRNYRFDKMSRSDIAARIIEHIERSDPRTRSKLEESMREALGQIKVRPTKEIDRTSFFSKWERIIKGLEL